MDKIFNKLNSINVSNHTEKKGNLTYLSWAWAWGELKKEFPCANYKIYENQDGWNYFTDGKTAWVKVGVEILGLEHIEYLPIMDYRNNSIIIEKLTSFDVNKAIQRALTKAIARHGLGLYIYAGEDLPETKNQTPDPTFQKDLTENQSLHRLAEWKLKVDEINNLPHLNNFIKKHNKEFKEGLNARRL